MKNLFLSLLFFFISVTSAGSLDLSIKGIEGAGNITAIIYDSEKAYNKDVKKRSSESYGTLIGVFPVSKDQKELSISYKTLDGRYVVFVFNDVNKNNDLDSNFFGIPKEPIGFTNDAWGFMGPSYEEASIEIKGLTRAIINLRKI